MTRGLIDASRMARLHPDTFETVSEQNLAGLIPGCFVKVCRNDERFWVLLTKVEGKRLTGEVNNDLMWNPDLLVGAVLTCEWRHVYDVAPPADWAPSGRTVH